jgi:nitrile hydratase subunit beta
MNGAQDLGGAMGFGPVAPEPDEPVFHAAWERRIFALTLAMGATGQWNLDMTRSARESLPPLQYLGSSYYRIWWLALERLLKERLLVSEQELADGVLRAPSVPGVNRLCADRVRPVLERGTPTLRQSVVPAIFCVGDPVLTRRMNPPGHTRLPRYARGRRGTVMACHGAHVYPDAHAAGLGEQPQWLYTVQFDARELWGEETTADAVCVDCWEPYLMRVDDPRADRP